MLIRLLIVLPPSPWCVHPVLPVSNLSEDSYDYVFGGRRKTPPATTSTTQIKLTTAPVRLRPEGEYWMDDLYTHTWLYNTFSTSDPTDAYQGENINNGRFYRHSFSYAPKRQRHHSRDDRDRESRLRCHGEDEATLRQLLLEYVTEKLEYTRSTRARQINNEHGLQQQATLVFLAVQLIMRHLICMPRNVRHKVLAFIRTNKQPE